MTCRQEQDEGEHRIRMQKINAKIDQPHHHQQPETFDGHQLNRVTEQQSTYAAADMRPASSSLANPHIGWCTIYTHWYT